MLIMKDMAFSWEDRNPCLHNVNLHIHRGEQWVITGENGAGKSTLLRLAAGLLAPSQGTLYLNGTETTSMKAVDKAAQAGMLFQEVERQLFHSSVVEEIRFGLRLQGLDKEVIEQRTADALALCELASVATKHPLDLHSGQRRMVAVACLCAMEPPLLLLDEPSRDFDPYWLAVFERWLSHSRERGATVLAISHDPEFTARNFQKVIHVCNGTVNMVS